ncbi:unnamed protein product [Rotaria sp. Silwood1]|nr:unnamed protein product [Rotaria sp. Silwood1]CAF1653621.1 unnamed protein product [Rotaria sp. Silwood1]CAF3872399.1 unnamed protein product [Rotaria sp. Silwood1]CAF3966086.1 unnamed protein product [Rotaria sp. Silwood1]CAF4988437.1 unnamed protein product [Rotaria sp. Silwood1]
MVNDLLIIGNKLVPNTIQRANYGMGSVMQVDRQGGYYYSASVRSEIPITRVAFVFLPSGTYSFNVGTRSYGGSGQFHNGIVTFELTQFENGNLASVGDYQLVNIPKQVQTLATE